MSHLTLRPIFTRTIPISIERSREETIIILCIPRKLTWSKKVTFENFLHELPYIDYFDWHFISVIRSLVRSPARPISFPRIDDSHCNRIHSSLTAVPCFDNSNVGKQAMAWKEYCADYWSKELQQSMNRCTDRRDIIEIRLKKGVKHHTFKVSVICVRFSCILLILPVLGLWGVLPKDTPQSIPQIQVRLGDSELPTLGFTIQLRTCH